MPERLLHLARMLSGEREPLARLRARQARKLRKLVRAAAATVPFYRELYAGIDVAAIEGPDDLQRLPVVDKGMLRTAGAGHLREDLSSSELVPLATSGSSGEPFGFRVTRSYDRLRKAQYLRPYLATGRGFTDRVLRLRAHATGRRPWLARLGLLREEEIGCAADAGQVLQRWQRCGATVLQGYPSSLRALAQHCRQLGRPLEPRPRRIYTDSEMLGADTRRLVETWLGASVIDVFGSYETDNIAYQCERGGAHHVTLDTVIVEVLRDGRPAPPGEEGELVVTVLDNLASPFIRYNLRDRVSWVPGPCPCGRSLPLLSISAGRNDDLLLLPDGSESSALQVLALLDTYLEEMRHYQLRQRAVDDFELLVVPARALSAAEAERMRAATAGQLRGARVTVRTAASLPPLRSGKWRAFAREPGLHA